MKTKICFFIFFALAHKACVGASFSNKDINTLTGIAQYFQDNPGYNRVAGFTSEDQSTNLAIMRKDKFEAIKQFVSEAEENKRYNCNLFRLTCFGLLGTAVYLC